MEAEVIIEKKTYKIGTIYLDSDGNITRIVTIPDYSFGPFWDIEAKDFDKVKLIISNKSLKPTS